MYIVFITILFSFIIHLICYFYVSRKDGYLNILSFYLLTSLPINFILEPLWIYYNGLFGSVYSYMYIYVCYAFIIFTITLGYRITIKSFSMKLPFSSFKLFNSKFYAYFLFSIAFLIYLPVLIEFQDFIFSPREIYIRTRTGYGFNFFISSFLASLSLICFLFSKRWNKFELLLFLLILVTFAYLHGSKSQILNLFLIVLMFIVYVRRWRVSIAKFSIIGLIISGFIVTLFYLTVNFKYDNLLRIIVGYSDYNRNAMLVIDSNSDFYFGQIIFESNFYSRIPRTLMPEKPKDFGEFKLAKMYFPSWFYADTGSPSFGIGVEYADFGYLSIVYLSAWGLLIGSLLNFFVKRLKKDRTPGDFIMLFFLAGGGLLPLGAGYLIFEHMLLAFIINLIFCLRIRLIDKI